MPAITAALLACAISTAADPPGADRRCGEYCLRVALPALGFSDDGTAAAVERLGVAPPGGHALADLAAAVEAAGGHALAVETTADNLRARQAAGDKFACVAHFDGDHWALLGGFEENGQAQVIDPPTSYDLPPETLARRWDGKALLLSRNALTPEADLPGPFPWLAAGLAAAGGALLLAVGGLWWSRREPAGKRVYTGPVSAAAVLLAAALPGCGGRADDAEPAPAAPPRAVFETVNQDAGTIPVRADGAGGHTFAFPLTNRGGAPLRVLGVSTSCGCTDAGATAEVLAPGETAEGRAVVSSTRPERKDARVVVRTNDPAAPDTVLSVRWNAVAPRSADPPELDLGFVRPGQTVERTVRLRRHAVAGGEAGTPGELTADPADRLAAEYLANDDASDGPTVRVRFTAPDTFGVGSGSVSVELAGGWTDRLRVPVRYTVRDLVAATPEALFLGAGPAGGHVRGRVVVSGHGPLDWTAPPVLDAAGDAWDGVRVTAQRFGPDRFLVDLDGPLPAAAGRHEAALRLAAVVSVDGAREVRVMTVPVSAFVLGAAPDAAGKAVAAR